MKMSHLPFAWISDEAKCFLSRFFENISSLPVVDIRENPWILSQCIVKTGNSINNVKTLYNNLILWIYFHQTLCKKKPDYEEVWQEILKVQKILKDYLEQRQMITDYSSLTSFNKVGFETEFKNVAKDLLKLGSFLRWGTVTHAADYVNLTTEERAEIGENLQKAKNNMLSFTIYQIVDPWNENGYYVTNINRLLYLGNLLITLHGSWMNMEKLALNTINEKKNAILKAIENNKNFVSIYSYQILSLPLTSHRVTSFFKILTEDFDVITKSLELHALPVKSTWDDRVKFTPEPIQTFKVLTDLSKSSLSNQFESSSKKTSHGSSFNPEPFIKTEQRSNNTLSKDLFVGSEDGLLSSVKKDSMILDEPRNSTSINNSKKMHRILQTEILDLTDQTMHRPEDKVNQFNEIAVAPDGINQVIDTLSKLDLHNSNKVIDIVSSPKVNVLQLPKNKIDYHSTFFLPENEVNRQNGVQSRDQLSKNSTNDLQKILELRERIKTIKQNNEDIFKLPSEKRRKEIVHENLQSFDDEHNEMSLPPQDQKSIKQKNGNKANSSTKTLNMIGTNDVNASMKEKESASSAKKNQLVKDVKWTPSSSLLDLSRRNDLLQKELFESGLGEKVKKLLTDFTDTISLEERSLKDVLEPPKKTDVSNIATFNDNNLKNLLNSRKRDPLFQNFSFTEKMQPVRSPFFLPNAEIQDFDSGSLLTGKETQNTIFGASKAQEDGDKDLIDLENSVQKDDDIVNKLVSHLTHSEEDVV